MMIKSINVLLLLVSSALLYSQTVNIEGHWRRIDLAQKSKDSKVQYGDLLLNSDSTFKMVGNDSKPKTETPGWHSGGTIKGKWSYHHNILSFYIEDVKLPVNYKILKLTKDDLIMVPLLSTTMQVKFKRV